jgi:hypothetical protein
MAQALTVVIGCALISVTFLLFDTDFWHHLLVGRTIWQMHSVPTTQLWSWPTYGQPEVNSAWLFRGLLWPMWHTWGVTGLFAWRWITTALTLLILFQAARRMGATGFAPLLALLACAFMMRLRSQVRPETMVAILMALQIWILEARRRGGPDWSPALAVIAWIWANTHLSYYLGFVILGVYLADAWHSSRGDAEGTGPAPRRLLWVGLAAIALSFLNPFGARALWQPFDFFLHNRHELLYRTILELKPVDWRFYIHTTLPLIVGGWALLFLWRLWRRAFDGVELALGVFFTVLAFSTQRFVGLQAVVAAPFLMRDLAEWTASRRWPSWTAQPWARALLVTVVCVAATWAETRRPEMPLGIGYQWNRYPVKACDFIAMHGIGGAGFNNLELGGYQAWRFWPDRSRLPFMTGTLEAVPREDRLLYAGVFAVPAAWRALDQRHHFDYVLIERTQKGDHHLLDVLDADSTWALVFADDAAALYLRRDGPLREQATSLAYHTVPAGNAGMMALGARMVSDSVLIIRAADELRMRAMLSPWNSVDSRWLGEIAYRQGWFDEARLRLEQALQSDPRLPWCTSDSDASP